MVLLSSVNNTRLDIFLAQSWLSLDLATLMMKIYAHSSSLLLDKRLKEHLVLKSIFIFQFFGTPIGHALIMYIPEIQFNDP